MAARIYTFFSENFTWTGGNGGACTNGKRAEAIELYITIGRVRDEQLRIYLKNEL